MTDSAELLVVLSKPEQRRLEQCIHDLPYAITWVESADEARETTDARPNLRAVVLDADQGDAWSDLAKDLLERNDKLAFLLARTYSDDSGEEVAEKDEIPISDVLVKPYNDELVRRRVERALGGGDRKPQTGAGKPAHPSE